MLSINTNNASMAAVNAISKSSSSLSTSMNAWRQVTGLTLLPMTPRANKLLTVLLHSPAVWAWR